MRWLGQALCALVWLGAACTSSSRAPAHPAMARDVVAERGAFDRLARELYEGMRRQSFDAVLLSRAELDDVLTPEARLRVERDRVALDGSLTRSSLSAGWAGAAYRGFCAQGARQEPAGSAYGLRSSATVLDRVLVVGASNTGDLAAWVEGRFVLTDQGFRALSVSRAEDPRAHHTDLELAPCDVEQGIR